MAHECPVSVSVWCVKRTLQYTLLAGCISPPREMSVSVPSRNPDSSQIFALTGTDNMMADGFTKPVDKTKFLKCRDYMMIKSDD